jgi:hypothetical protein
VCSLTTVQCGATNPQHCNNKTENGKARSAKGSKSRWEHAMRTVCLAGIMRQHRAGRERPKRGPW